MATVGASWDALKCGDGVDTVYDVSVSIDILRDEEVAVVGAKGVGPYGSRVSFGELLDEEGR